MLFAGAPPKYDVLLTGVEALCAKVACLQPRSFSIEVRADSLPESLKPHAGLGTASSPESCVIAVNEKVFDGFPPAIQRGIILHELAHALIAKPDSSSLKACIDADLLVVEWGLAPELLEAAEHDCGAEYAQLLRLAHAGSVLQARDELDLWAIQVRAGTITLPCQKR